MMEIISRVDVIVVGAGPTGLTLANLLGKLGVATMIVESRATTSNLPRAIVMDDEGARTMQACGLAEKAVAESLIGEGSRYESPDGKTIAHVGRGNTEFGFGKRHFISQPKLERTLDEGLSRWPSVLRRFSTSLVELSSHDDGVVATVRSEGEVREVNAKWAVACDGGPIREAMHIPFEGNTYNQDWVVLDLASDPHDINFTRFICDPRRPTVIVPAPDGGRRYEFMLLPGESRENATTPAFLETLLRPFRPYRAEDVIRAAVYTFHARVAARWKVGRILLAGDAAHLTPPFAGQGMNAGLRDANNLAWKLAAHVRGLASASLLDSYELERREPCLAMIQLAVLMGKIIMPRSSEEATLQNAIMMLTDESPALKQHLFEMRFKPRPFYEAGALIRASTDVPASLVGHMIPQPRVETQTGPVLLDERLGDGFCLIGQMPGAFDMSEARHPLWARLKPKRVNLYSKRPSEFANGVDSVWVSDPSALKPFTAHRDQLMLVRPDRYVAGAFLPAEIDHFASLFDSMLRRPESKESLPVRCRPLTGRLKEKTDA